MKNRFKLNPDCESNFKEAEYNPYSKGNCVLNCFHILCGPIPPSYESLYTIAYNESCQCRNWSL